jgi:repressor of nif and glnA expression
MNPAEIVVNEMQSKGMAEVFNLLREGNGSLNAIIWNLSFFSKKVKKKPKRIMRHNANNLAGIIDILVTPTGG